MYIKAEGNYGVKCTVEGYYKMTCHMFFHSTEQNASVAVRFAKGDLNNNVNNSGFENPGPVQVSGPITNIPAGRYSIYFRTSRNVGRHWQKF